MRHTGLVAGLQTAVMSVLILGPVAGYLTTRSGGPAAKAAATLTGAAAPACGELDDGKIHVPPDWTTFEPPAVGHSYADPAFGCSVMRLTDGAQEETTSDGKHLSFMNYYSTLSAVNAGDSMVLITSDDGGWRIKSVDGKLVVASDKMPTMNSGHPVWDASNGEVFYYTHGNALYRGSIEGGSVKGTAIYTFSEYRGIVSPDAADLSQDGDHIALVGQNPSNTMDVFVWSLSEEKKTSVYTTSCQVNQWGVTQTPQPGCVHKLLLTPDNRLATDFTDDGTGVEQGLRLWDGSRLIHLQDSTNHIDTGYDASGKPVFIDMGRSSTLAGEDNPCSSGWGLDVRELNDLSAATCLLDKQPSWHVSYRGSPAQPWAALSFFDDGKSGPELFNGNAAFEKPTFDNWVLYQDEIMLVRIDRGSVYRLAHARSRSAEGYWNQPHAAISRDGKYVVFTSNMAHPNGCPAGMHVPGQCTDVYLIRVR
jgi:hypothetical protein